MSLKYSNRQILIIIAIAGLLAAFSKYIETTFNINFFITYFSVLVVGLAIKKLLRR